LDHRTGSGGFFEYFGAFNLFLNDDVRCGSRFNASAVTTQSV
jgi:hypothetical protein